MLSVTAHVLTVVFITVNTCHAARAVSVGVNVIVLVSALAAVQVVNVQDCVLAATCDGVGDIVAHVHHTSVQAIDSASVGSSFFQATVVEALAVVQLAASVQAHQTYFLSFHSEVA